MKKIISMSFLFFIGFFLMACSNEKSEKASLSKSVIKSELEVSSKSSDITDTAVDNEISNSILEDESDEFEESSSDIELDSTDSSVEKPSDLEIMTYAQTVLDDFYKNCKYSRNKRDYNIIGTGLRYKIEGEVALNSSSNYEKFYMIILFTDNTYKKYDLISLQIGKETVYNNKKAQSDLPPKSDSDKEILSEKNAKIYNEVMDALNDYSREEDEILEEIAPKYNMSFSELKQFLFEYMEAYYE